MSDELPDDYVDLLKAINKRDKILKKDVMKSLAKDKDIAHRQGIYLNNPVDDTIDNFGQEIAGRLGMVNPILSLASNLITGENVKDLAHTIAKNKNMPEYLRQIAKNYINYRSRKGTEAEISALKSKYIQNLSHLVSLQPNANANRSYNKAAINAIKGQHLLRRIPGGINVPEAGPYPFNYSNVVDHSFIQNYFM